MRRLARVMQQGAFRYQIARHAVAPTSILVPNDYPIDCPWPSAVSHGNGGDVVP
jgi:hypothetical protein